MAEQIEQTFNDSSTCQWLPFGEMAGVSVVPLAVPVPDGSIHRARLAKGTVIPPHSHPADEYVLVVTGVIETSGRRCEPGTFWVTPADIRQGPHIALTDTELLTVRLGALGDFEQ